MISPLLSPERAAQILDIEPPAVLALITSDQLHGVEVLPGVWRVAPADLRRFVAVRKRTFRPVAESA